MQRILSYPVKPYLLLLVTVMLAITFLLQEFVQVPQLLNMPMVSEVIRTKMLESFNNWRWLLLIIPIGIMIIRLLMVSFCLYIGSFFYEPFEKLNYPHCWNIAVKTDSISVIYSALACTISITLGPDTWTYINNHLSLIFLIGTDISENWLLIPITAVNAFEICYWLILAAFITNKQNIRYSSALRYTASTYGIGYLFYIVFLMFLLLYFT